MSDLLDGVIAASIICDMIEAFRARGIVVTLDNIDAEMARRDAEREAINKALGI